MKLVTSDHWRDRRSPNDGFHRLYSKRVAMDGGAGRHEEDMFDFSTHWAYALFGTAVAFVALIAISIYVIIKRRRPKGDSPDSPLATERPKQPVPQCPPLAIQLTTSQQQQQLPNTAHYIGGSSPQPIRIKCSNRPARGLLERRGSNASLTIDVNPESSFQCGSPPKECSAEEYLTSAGNRMTRKQLRMCLKQERESKTLEREFLDIPLNHPGKLDLPGCSNKNRYKSIWPNENTRVKLPERNGDPSTTYINANYVRGYDGEPKCFIATQGPLLHTINDFWLAVWNEGVSSIVMMTKLKEKHKAKCEAYVPTREAQYGSIHVTVRMTVGKNGYYLRELILQRDNELRQIKHYWFTGWPDHKAPASTCCQLVELAQDVLAEKQRQKQSKGLTGPIIVHCSAGIGRTGCLIGTCIGIRQLKEENMADILGIVCQMRLDRGGMIQTPEQYEFLHRALAYFERQLPETPTTAALPLTSSSSSTTSKNTSPSS